MNYRALGKTGLKVSELSLGSWTTYGGSVANDDAIQIVRKAFDLGVNLFDTADVYVRGGAENLLGQAIVGLPREQLVIATKCMGRVWDGPLGAGLSRKHIFDAMDQSLRRLGVDYVDLYQAHAPDAGTPIEETLRAFEDLVRMGKARYVGFSNFDREPALARRVVEIQGARGWDPMISSQPRYNLVDRHVEREHIAFCKKNGIGMIVYSPLAQGVLTNKYAGGARPEGSRANTNFAHFLTAEKALTPENVASAERFAAWCSRQGAGTPAQIALAWVLREPQVSSAITGATRLEQLEENLKAGEIKLADSEWKEVEAAISGAPARTSHARSNGNGAAPKKKAPTAKNAPNAKKAPTAKRAPKLVRARSR
ncbi:MAG TPA: aldo/keto reductase [Candidatus Sulfotelmatobacter sp.]|nr:aldo/keto reductase [Candidatus Sulfotelmatobacter sp.]